MYLVKLSIENKTHCVHHLSYSSQPFCFAPQDLFSFLQYLRSTFSCIFPKLLFFFFGSETSLNLKPQITQSHQNTEVSLNRKQRTNITEYTQAFTRSYLQAFKGSIKQSAHFKNIQELLQRYRCVKSHQNGAPKEEISSY